MSGILTPFTAKVWSYTKTAGGLESHMTLKETTLPKRKSTEHLIRVIAASVNPVDYKPSEAPVVGSLLVSGKPAIPGQDIAGEIVTPASNSNLIPGQLVFGATGGPMHAGGALSEYVNVSEKQVVAIPDGVSCADAAAIPIAGLTAYQSLKPYVKSGDKVFLNGGSGGVGLFSIQIAKVLGCHVTTTCSTKNVDFCKTAGADDVLDYTKGNLIATLAALPHKFDHVVDNIGAGRDLYWKCDQYTKSTTKFINIATSPHFSDISFMTKAFALPSLLGGQKRKFVQLICVPTQEDLQQVGAWVQDGRVKVHIDKVFPMQAAPEAIKSLKTGRTRGKIIVEVAAEKSAVL